MARQSESQLTSESRGGEGLSRRLIARYLFRETMGWVIMGLALFWPAGTVRWWPAWSTLAVMAGWIAATAYIVIRVHPTLLAERLGPRRDTKRWDLLILGLLGLTQLGRYLLAGWDHRLASTAGFPIGAQLAALAVCVFGYALVVWATAANPFFSQIMRIQSERDHHVVTSGPYRFVRHPAYAGAMLYELAVAVLLDSWRALAMGGLGVLLLLGRTALEDRALQQELAGYADYARLVRHRLIPLVW